jgi:hypothetical protein
MLTAVDESLGRILEALAKQGVLDDTVVLLTGDNGYFYGEHGLSEERRLAYEESIRVPLLVRYPRLVKPGWAPAQMALTIDLAPTLLELGGAAPEHPLDGRSLVPVLRGMAPSSERRSWSSTGATSSFRGSSEWATTPSAPSATSTSATGSYRGWTSSTTWKPIRTSFRTSSGRLATRPSRRRRGVSWVAFATEAQTVTASDGAGPGGGGRRAGGRGAAAALRTTAARTQVTGAGPRRGQWPPCRARRRACRALK